MVKARKKTNTPEGVVAQATVRRVRISPLKARLMIDLIRGRQIEPAMQILKFSPRKSAAIMLKLLNSALSNASDKKGVNVDALWVTGGFVDSGPTMKRYMPGAHGRANLIKKRSSNITLLLGER